MKWKRGTFKIAINPRAMHCDGENGMRDGYVCGQFGIAKRTWVITHLPSGLKLAERADKLREAKAIAARLHALPVAWADTDPLHSVSEDMRRDVRAIVLGRD